MKTDSDLVDECERLRHRLMEAEHNVGAQASRTTQAEVALDDLRERVEKVEQQAGEVKAALIEWLERHAEEDALLALTHLTMLLRHTLSKDTDEEVDK